MLPTPPGLCRATTSRSRDSNWAVLPSLPEPSGLSLKQNIPFVQHMSALHNPCM